MLYGLYLSAMGLQVQEYRQAVTANNLANVQTAGFKRDLANVMARPNAAAEDPAMRAYRLPVYAQQGGGVWAMPTAMDLRQASLTPTGNKTDLALDGAGFFVVRGAQGQSFLTRNGQFLLNADGELVTAGDGHPVLDPEGEPVKINPKEPFEITARGEIRQGGRRMASLAVVEPENGSLHKIGQNLLRAEGQTRPATGASVHQGHLEASGVDPMTEMVQMLEGQRVFEANARMITYQDQTLQQLNTIGRVA